MKELFKALSLAQAEFPTLVKDSSAGGRYKYADLPSIIKKLDPVLRKHHLVVSQLVEDGINNCPAIKTVLCHTESGEMLESTVSLPEADLKGMNVYQVMGSAITYFRRYTLCAMLGVVGDDDDDTASVPAQLKQEKPQEKQFIKDEMFDNIIQAKKEKFKTAQELISAIETTFSVTKAQKDKIIASYADDLSEGIALLDPDN